VKAHGMRGLKTIFALAIAGSLLAATAAQASVYPAEGAATADPSTEVSLDLDAKVKKGKLKRAGTVSRFHVVNAPFECSATGESGRADYGFTNEPITVAKNGEFSDVYELYAGSYVVERYTLSGKVTGKGRSAIVTGTFQAERGAGGIKFNNCSTGPVPFKAKAKLG
jgi:hypothetical protein